MRRFIIDTDTASDDAVAILMALQWPDVQVEAITVVAGNVPLEQGGINARYTVEICGKDTPVYLGSARPLLREPVHAHFFHGEDGMGNMHYPPPERPVAGRNGVLELIRRFREAPGEIELVTLGPLTNIALALRLEPDLAHWIKHCTIMGGAANTVGNITPAAEYNLWFDPEAAKIVFHSGMAITMAGWELCRGDANLSDEEIAMIYGFGTVRAKFAMDCNKSALQASREWLHDPGLGLCDPTAMAVALNPDVCIRRGDYFVDIATQEEMTRGMSIVDALGVTNQPPNAEVCWEIDAAAWKETLYRALR
jgi:purine nucleosidase